MRRSISQLVWALLIASIPVQAGAGPLGFVGALTLQIGNLSPVQMPGVGVAIVNGSSGPGHLTGLNLAGGTFGVASFVLPVTDPLVIPIRGIQVTASANGAGNFGGVGGAGFGGIMPISGTAKVCLFGPCSSAAANLSVPLSGVGDQATGFGDWVFVAGAVNLTVVGAPWTTGTVSVGGVTAMGGVSPLSSTGAPSGNLTLVTPIFISTNLGTSPLIPSFGFLSLHFVPEPSTVVLLGLGIAGLLASGRSSARK